MPVGSKLKVDVRKVIEQMALDPHRVEKLLSLPSLNEKHETELEEVELSIVVNS